MTISSAQSSNVAVGSGDTTLLNPTSGRAMITLGSLHEQTGNTETVDLYISSDATSAAGERIDSLSFAANETKVPSSLQGMAVPSGYYLIGNAGTGARVMASITYTQYSGDS